MNVPQAFLLAVIALLFYLTVLMVLPFLQFFLLAVMLAYLLLPIQHRLENRVGSRTAALLIVICSSVAIVIPLVYFARITILEAAALVQAVRDGEITLERQEERIREITGLEVDIADQILSVAADVEITSFIGVVDTITHVLIGIALTLFLLYYFLKDRDSFLKWLYRTTPLTDDVQERIYSEIDLVMKAVLVGHVFVAFVQGALAGIGLFVTGVPNATLWTGVMIVLALLPLVGSFMVWGPASAYLFLNGEPVLGVVLFVWGATIVTVSDDFLRPIVVDRYSEINPSVIIIGVFGGIYVIGLMGIFFGPLIIAILRATLDVFREEYSPVV